MLNSPHISKKWIGVFFALFLLGVGGGVGAQGQGETTHYWEHEAVGAVRSVYVTDIGGDDFLEFFVISNESNVELVLGNGRPYWAEPLKLTEPVVSAMLVDRFGYADLGVEERRLETLVLVVTESALWLFDLEKNVVGGWVDEHRLGQTAISAEVFDHDLDGEDSVLVRFANAELGLYNLDKTSALYNAEGGFFETGFANVPNPLIAEVAEEGSAVFYAYETAFRGRLVRLLPPGQETDLWEEVWVRELSNRVTAMTRTEEGLAVAFGAQLLLVDSVNGQNLRESVDVGASINAIETGWWQNERVLFVGTEDGRLIGYRADGSEAIVRYFCTNDSGNVETRGVPCKENTEGELLQISAWLDPDPVGFPLELLAIRLQSNTGVTELAILDSNLINVGQFPASLVEQPDQLIDVNQDGSAELLLPRFGRLELVNPSTDTRTILEAWDYSLDGQLNSLVAVDLDNDEIDDLVVGAGFNVHRILDNGSARWVNLLDGEVVDLALLSVDEVTETDSFDDPPHILVGYNASVGETDQLVGHVTLFRNNNRRVWIDEEIPSRQPIVLDAPLTAVYLDATTPFLQTLLLGTATGTVEAYRIWESDNGWFHHKLWEDPPSLATQPVILEITRLPENSDRFTLVTERNIYQLDMDNGHSLLVETVGTADEPTVDHCRVSTDLLYLLNVSSERDTVCFNRTLGEWTTILGTNLLADLKNTEKFIYRPLSQTSLRVESRLEETNLQSSNDRSEILEITSFINTDFTGDGSLDVAYSFDNEVIIDLNDVEEKRLSFTGEVEQIATMQEIQGARPTTSLVVTTRNSKLYLYRFRPNYPPLLSYPTAESDGDQYTVEVTVQDAEQDDVEVLLQTWNGREWRTLLEPQTIQPGPFGSQLSWVLDSPTHNQPVRYRFLYSDGGEDRLFEPPAGPPPSGTRFVQRNLTVIGSFISIIAIGLGFIAYFRSRGQPPAVARRIYDQIAGEPNLTLPHMQSVYEDVYRAPELLLTLASRSRQKRDPIVSQISDGLFLLDSQPMAGISLVKESLDEIRERDDAYSWRDVKDWEVLFDSAEILLTAPTLSELTLYEPQLQGFIDVSKTAGEDDPSSARLRTIFESFKASTRVETDEDRLTYLNDAAALLRRLESEVDLHPRVLSIALTRAIVERWLAMTRSEIETLRGRARLDLELKTELVSPSEIVPIAVKIENHGRAPAEQIKIRLLEGAATPLNQTTITIPYLGPGRNRTVQFDVQIPGEDRFRIAFEVTYNDSHRQNKTFDYANIVNVLTPARDFSPINNPYSPGTPLRKNSPLFFGREDLFGFIADTAQNLQKKVLIMVGQRRTGKTSALLRLSDNLPPELLAVYIDCQSLGVVPGMPAFIQDLVWAISDALALRDIDLDVPDLFKDTQNPSTWFEREFVPHLRSILPENTQTLLVFDEFEAFENLVKDGILPPNFFPYLRHLMQHAEGLGFVFVGTHRLEQMSIDYWSVLFNIALYKEITYLSREKANELIEKPVAGSLLYDDLALDKIWRLTAGHPYFLQLVCYGLVKQANELKKGYITISDVNSAVSDMLGLGEVHFVYLWNESSPAEKNLLTAIAHLIDNEIPFRPDELLTALAPYNIILTPAETTAALNSLVQRHILRELSGETTPTYEVNLALIEHWVEQTKGLGALFT